MPFHVGVSSPHMRVINSYSALDQTRFRVKSKFLSCNECESPFLSRSDRKIIVSKPFRRRLWMLCFRCHLHCCRNILFQYLRHITRSDGLDVDANNYMAHCVGWIHHLLSAQTTRPHLRFRSFNFYPFTAVNSAAKLLAVSWWTAADACCVSRKQQQCDLMQTDYKVLTDYADADEIIIIIIIIKTDIGLKLSRCESVIELSLSCKILTTVSTKSHEFCSLKPARNLIEGCIFNQYDISSNRD